MNKSSGFYRRPWRPWMICLLLTGVIVATSFIPRVLAKEVTVIVDDRKVSIATKNGTVKQLLETYNITIGPYDKVIPEVNTPLKDGMKISVLRATPVTINDDGQVKTLYTTASSIKGMLEEANISLRQEDNVEPSLDQSIYPGLSVKINRAIPIKLIADGNTKDIYTTEQSVEQVLADAGIKLDAKDKVQPALNSNIKSGMTIEIIRVNETYENVEAEVPYKTIIRNNNNMAQGQQKVVQNGQNGRMQRKILITYENGKEVSRKVVSETITVQPQNKIVERGTIRNFVTSRGDYIRYSRVLTMTATAYTAGEDGVDNTTCTGQRARRGVVAVDPNVIPLGTRLYVEGYGFAVAADVGGAIKGNKIDLYMDTLSQTRNFGRRTVKVYILR